MVRLNLGVALAGVAGVSHQIGGAFGALGVGIAAPLVVEKLAAQFPASAAPEGPADDRGSPASHSALFGDATLEELGRVVEQYRIQVRRGADPASEAQEVGDDAG